MNTKVISFLIATKIYWQLLENHQNKLFVNI